MMTKICSKCGEEKQINDFTKDKRRQDGVTGVCLMCFKSYHVNYYMQNKTKIKNKVKKYSKKNKQKISEYHKKYYSANKESLSDYIKVYREKNKDKINDNESNRKKDSIYKLKHIVRNRIYVYFKNKGVKKNCKTFKMIGCSPEELKEHIEKHFDEGMSWKKLGKGIHIDHIIPLSSAKSENEMYKLCHYTNLQPLWAKDNLTKSNKIC